MPFFHKLCLFLLLHGVLPTVQHTKLPPDNVISEIQPDGSSSINSFVNTVPIDTIPTRTKYHLSKEIIFEQRKVKELKSNYDVRILNQIEKTMQRQEHEFAEKLARSCLTTCSLAAYGEAGR